MVWLRGARCAIGVCGLFDDNGGLRAAAAWRLHKTYKTYKTYKITIGAPCDTPRVCCAVVWFCAGDKLPQGTARQLDGGGGMRKRGGVTLA